MREQVVHALQQMLSSNIGNRLTNELATGIATMINHHFLQAELEEKMNQPSEDQTESV